LFKYFQKLDFIFEAKLFTQISLLSMVYLVFHVHPPTVKPQNMHSDNFKTRGENLQRQGKTILLLFFHVRGDEIYTTQTTILFEDHINQSSIT